MLRVVWRDADVSGRDADAEPQDIRIFQWSAEVVDVVLAVAAIEEVRIAARSTVENIGAGPAFQNVVSGIADELIIACPTAQDVGAVVALQDVVSVAPVEHIILYPAVQRVVAAEPVQRGPFEYRIRRELVIVLRAVDGGVAARLASGYRVVEEFIQDLLLREHDAIGEFDRLYAVGLARELVEVRIVRIWHQ